MAMVCILIAAQANPAKISQKTDLKSVINSGDFNAGWTRNVDER